MLDKIKEYAELKARYDIDKDEMAKAIAEVKATDRYQVLSHGTGVAKLALDTLATEIREGAIAKFATDGNKKPWDGIGVRVSTEIGYSENEVTIEWAGERFPDTVSMAIKKSLFKKNVKALIAEGVKLPDFIEVTEKVTATISKDLSAYL